MKTTERNAPAAREPKGATQMFVRPTIKTLFVLAAAAAAAPLLVSCGGAPRSAAAERPAAVAAPVAVAALAETPEFASATGEVAPYERANPGTKLLGRVERVFAREGDAVRAGQTLAALDAADVRAQVGLADAAVASAQAQYDNAAAMYRRIQTLAARGSATAKNLEDAAAGNAMAAAGLAQAQAGAAAARATLAYAEVKAPISGLVSAKRIEVGDMAAPGAPLFTIDDVSRVKVLAELAEADLAGVVPGAPARARIDALGREFAATVDRVSPAGDPRSRTFEVQIVVDNKDGALRPGMYARALFPKAPRKALFVPKSALTTRGELVGLYALDDEGAARLRWVRVGREDGDKVEVLCGLAAGERYVAAPPAELVDGAPVAAR